MILSYLKVRFNIIYRNIIGLGLFRIIIILSILSLIIYNSHVLFESFSYRRIVLSFLYFASILSFTIFRKDVQLLISLRSRYKRLFFIENLILSIPFALIDFSIFPLYILVNIFVVLFYNYFVFLRPKKTTIIKSFFRIGSIEWESLFRRYSLYAVLVWILLFIIALYIQSDTISLVAVVGFTIELTAINYFVEPLFYLKQHQNKTAFYAHKMPRILLHAIIPTYVLFGVYIIVFSHKIIMAISISIAASLYVLVAFYIKLAIMKNQFILRLSQGLFLSICIISILNPSFIIVLIFSVSYIMLKSHKNLKELYD